MVLRLVKGRVCPPDSFETPLSQLDRPILCIPFLVSPMWNYFFSVDCSAKGLACGKAVSRRLIQPQDPLDAPRRARQLFFTLHRFDVRVRVSVVFLGILDLELVWKVSITALEAWKGQMLGVEVPLALIVTQPWNTTPSCVLHVACVRRCWNSTGSLWPDKPQKVNLYYAVGVGAVVPRRVL